MSVEPLAERARWNSAAVRLGAGLVSSPVSLSTDQVVAAAEHPLAVAAALDILAEGGTAADAVVAAAFTLAAVDPGASGIGGGGYLLYRTPDGRTTSIDFSMRAPRSARPGCYKVLDHDAGSRFGWRAVDGDRNLTGPGSVAVPGMLPGMAATHRTFGRLPWTRLLQPAIAHASEGVETTWTTSLRIVSKSAALRRWDASADVLLPQGLPLRCSGTYGGADVLRQTDLARTLEVIALEGPEAMTTGVLARRVGAWLEEHGSMVGPGDLADVQAITADALTSAYRGHVVHGPPAACGSPTAQQLLGVLDLLEETEPATAILQHVAAARLCFADRATFGAHQLKQLSGLRQLLAPERLREHAAAARGLSIEAPARQPQGDSTTHLSVADAEGNLAAMTLTLADNFGSAVTVPGTGIMMNNAMQWHDPLPDRPTSVGPMEPGLNNMAPLVVVSPHGSAFAVGSAGGVRILEAVTHIVQGLAAGLHPQQAIEAPRIDCSGRTVLLDPRLSDHASSIRALGEDVVLQPDELHTHHYSRPVVVSIEASGQRRAGVDPARMAAAAGW